MGAVLGKGRKTYPATYAKTPQARPSPEAIRQASEKNTAYVERMMEQMRQENVEPMNNITIEPTGPLPYNKRSFVPPPNQKIMGRLRSEDIGPLFEHLRDGNTMEETATKFELNVADVNVMVTVPYVYIDPHGKKPKRTHWSIPEGEDPKDYMLLSAYIKKRRDEDRLAELKQEGYIQ